MRTWIIRPWVLRPWMFFVAPVLLSGPQFSHQGLFIEGRGDDTHTRRRHVPYRITSHTHTPLDIHTRTHNSIHTHYYTHTPAPTYPYTQTHIFQFTHIRVRTPLYLHAFTSHILTFINIQILKCHIYTLKYGHKTQIPIPTHTAYTND